jgi:hypothetical protein
MISTQPDMIQYLDTALPISSVLAQTHAFLERCYWKLEIDNEIIEITKNVELVVHSRAFVKADLDDLFLGDHFEAVVLLGQEIVGENVCARYGVLRMYFNLDGQFVSEDRYNKHV